MNKKQFTAVLQVVLWLNDDMKLEHDRLCPKCEAGR